MQTIPSVAGQGEGANPMQSSFNASTILLILTLAGFSLPASAGLPIEILENKNSTLLDITKFAGASGTNHIQKQTSQFSINDTIYSWNGVLAGEVSATQFNVSAMTRGLAAVAPVVGTWAFATNEVSFLSLVTTTATLGFETSMTGGFHVNDNQIRVRLFEVDSGQVLLNYYWDRSVGNSGVGSAQVNFNAGANYILSISAWSIEDSSGPWDQTVTSLRVTGFDPISVPEPTTASIIGLGLLAWFSRQQNKNHLCIQN